MSYREERDARLREVAEGILRNRPYWPWPRNWIEKQRHYVVDFGGIPLVWPHYECTDDDAILAATTSVEAAYAAERLLSLPDGPLEAP